MQLWVSQLRLAFIAGYLLRGARAGAGEQDSHFLGKRPGLNQDVQLWNDFLRSENQPDNQGLTDAVRLDSDISDEGGLPHGTAQRSAAFLDATTQGHDHLEQALRSCLKKHGGPSAAMPVPVPHGNLAAVAAAAVASLKPASQSNAKLLKVQLEACLETAQQDDLAEKAVPMKTVASKTTTTLGPIIVPPNTGPRIETALVATNFSDPCANGLKQCKKDVKNCKHVLDILQFLRLQHIAVEQNMQREAQAKHGRGWKLLQSGPLLQTVLEKHGFSLPKPEDWDWTDGKKLLLQSALEQHSLALIDEDWPPRSPDLVHPIPVLAPAQQHQVPPPSEGTMKVSFARPVRLEIHHTRCPAHVKKELDDCGLSLQSCKVDVDDHNAILNSIAGRANQEREAKLVEYLRPPRDYSRD